MSKPKYTHLSQRNQILKRPAQHIGSTKNVVKDVWTAITEYSDENEMEKIVKQSLEINPGLIHIFYEVLGNAQDNYFKSLDGDTPLKKIDVNVDIETGKVSVWNDGNYIPARIHEWDDDEEVIDDNEHYEAEIIFGNLNSSSNYNDDEVARRGGGLHGVGVKLTNIFSKEFQVIAFDPEEQLKFVCTWSDNMTKMGRPKVTTLKQKKGFTTVSYIADFEKFGLEGYTESHIAVMRKLCVDCAMITGQQIIFNGEKIPVKNLLAYANLYTDGEKIEFKTDNTHVILAEKPAFEVGFSQISFVNGINTTHGGVHVDAWRSAIFKPLVEKIRSKYSKGKGSTPVKVTPKSLEQYFMIFINCNLENPDFEGQTKGVLTSPTPVTNVPDSKITKLMRWNFIHDIDETVRIQGMKELQKTDGKKTTSINIPKAVDANKAGTVKSIDCTLFITEGLSAKTFAVKGISALENGTDYYGILPVRGKVLNVRGASAEQINKNVELSALKKMLGLQHGADYSKDEEYRKLRYGRIIILTDADHDGDHIKGLLINFFKYFYPTLIERGIVQFVLGGQRTPIVKATIGKKIVTFYYIKDFKEWAGKQKNRFTIHYYKGLGTSTDEEIIEIFQNPLYSRYLPDKDSSNTVDKLFSTKRADERKQWLSEYNPKEFKYERDGDEECVPISDFINNEMIEFSLYDNHRSIPSVVDGLKPSQRKVMFVALKILNQTTNFKVAQFANRVAEMAEYHHGEDSLVETVTNMAQTYLGSNNIAMLHEAGQFGSRLEGGRDAAAGRYIFTHLSSIARFIFRKEDDPILDYLEEDGKQIEPKFFVPVVPLLLVNGARGIGTGYSTDIPSFNPIELVEWVRQWLDEKDTNSLELEPWYRGFKGTTEKINGKYTHYGVVQREKDYYRITELPPGIWTEDYKEKLDELKSGVTSSKVGYDAMTVPQLKEELAERSLPVSGAKKALVDRLKKWDRDNGAKMKKIGGSGQIITKWEWYGDAYNVDFKVWTKGDIEIDSTDPKFKLCKTEGLTNMTAFNPVGGITKYESLNDILKTYCEVRLEYYTRRKKNLIKVLEESLQKEKSKARFIGESLEDFDMLRQTEAELFEYFEENNYYKDHGESFSYLTGMPIRIFNSDKYEELLKTIEKIKNEINYVKKKTPKQMWKIELTEFVDAYKKWTGDIEKLHEKLAKMKMKKNKKHGKK